MQICNSRHLFYEQVVVLCPSVVSLFCNILSQQQCFEFDWLKNLEKKK